MSRLLVLIGVVSLLCLVPAAVAAPGETPAENPQLELGTDIVANHDCSTVPVQYRDSCRSSHPTDGSDDEGSENGNDSSEGSSGDNSGDSEDSGESEDEGAENEDDSSTEDGTNGAEDGSESGNNEDDGNNSDDEDGSGVSLPDGPSIPNPVEGDGDGNNVSISLPDDPLTIDINGPNAREAAASVARDGYQSLYAGTDRAIDYANSYLFSLPAPGQPDKPSTWMNPRKGWWTGVTDSYWKLAFIAFLSLAP